MQTEENKQKRTILNNRQRGPERLTFFLPPRYATILYTKPTQRCAPSSSSSWWIVEETRWGGRSAVVDSTYVTTDRRALLRGWFLRREKQRLESSLIRKQNTRHWQQQQTAGRETLTHVFAVCTTTTVYKSSTQTHTIFGEFLVDFPRNLLRNKDNISDVAYVKSSYTDSTAHTTKSINIYCSNLGNADKKYVHVLKSPWPHFLVCLINPTSHYKLPFFHTPFKTFCWFLCTLSSRLRSGQGYLS